MVNNDQIIGLIMAIVSIAVMFVETFILIIQPAVQPGFFSEFPAAQYWGIAIPVFFGLFVVLAIVFWIGITMYTTPPPEAWDFEEFEEEFEKDDDDDEEGDDDDEEDDEKDD